jgi:hypothetical protein
MYQRKQIPKISLQTEYLTFKIFKHSFHLIISTFCMATWKQNNFRTDRSGSVRRLQRWTRSRGRTRCSTWLDQTKSDRRRRHHPEWNKKMKIILKNKCTF